MQGGGKGIKFSPPLLLVLALTVILPFVYPLYSFIFMKVEGKKQAGGKQQEKKVKQYQDSVRAWLLFIYIPIWMNAKSGLQSFESAVEWSDEVWTVWNYIDVNGQEG